MRDAETARRIMKILVDHGWALEVEDGVKIGGKRYKEGFERLHQSDGC